MFQRREKMFEFLRRQKISCEMCPNEYRKGTGHLCWCPECKEPHSCCNSCYLEGKKSGAIIDKVKNITDLDNKNRERYT